jgi:hypothetical protein
MPFTKTRKMTAAKIRRADIIVIGKKEFIVTDNEPISYVIPGVRLLTLKPIKPGKNAIMAGLSVADTEKLKIIRHK